MANDRYVEIMFKSCVTVKIPNALEALDMKTHAIAGSVEALLREWGSHAACTMDNWRIRSTEEVHD